MLLVLAFVCLAGAGFLIAEIVSTPARLRHASVSRASTYGKLVLRKGDTRSFRERAVAPTAGRVAAAVLRLSPKTTVEAVSLKLLSAGMTLSAQTFLSIKGGGAALGFLLGLVFGGSVGGPGIAFLLGVTLAAGGW